MMEKARYDGSENAPEASMQQFETDAAAGRMLAGAVERIANGTYGHCSNCLKTIASRRLLALPWVKFCATCQDLIDSSR